MTYTAIVATTPEGRVSKYLSFETADEASEHCEKFGGFSVENLDAPLADWLIVDGRVTVVSSANLDAIRANLLAWADWEAGKRIGSPVSRVHAEKREQAEQAIADGSAAAIDFPLLAVSMIEADGGDLLATAHRVRSAYLLDMQRIASVEGVRLSAKSAIKSATTVDEFEAVRASITWPD